MARISSGSFHICLRNHHRIRRRNSLLTPREPITQQQYDGRCSVALWQRGRFAPAPAGCLQIPEAVVRQTSILVATSLVADAHLSADDRHAAMHCTVASALHLTAQGYFPPTCFDDGNPSGSRCHRSYLHRSRLVPRANTDLPTLQLSYLHSPSRSLALTPQLHIDSPSSWVASILLSSCFLSCGALATSSMSRR